MSTTAILTYTAPNTQAPTNNASTSTNRLTLYADKVNSQFVKNQSHYFGVADRITEQTKNSASKQQVLSSAVAEFKRRNPHITAWSDITLCNAVRVNMDLIDIDSTMQRLLDVPHAANILMNFEQILVMPICVYEDPLRPGRYICWDGQHTLIVLYLIAAKAFGCDISQCQIPVVIYASLLKSEMRNCFIRLNGDAKKPLDPIDIYQQKVFGVRIDSSNNPDWQINEKKQSILEKYKMFATNDKFGDDTMPGALTRVKELLDKTYPIEVTNHFCNYFYHVCGSSRAVQSKEPEMLYEFFELCHRQKIMVDDDYVKGVAKSLQAVDNGDFDAEKLWVHAKLSYQNWWLRSGMSIDGSLRGIQYPKNAICMTFIIAQIEKNFTGLMPAFPKMWIVPKGDLF